MKPIFSFIFISIFTFLFSQTKQDLGEFDFVEIYDKIPVKLVKSDKNSVEINGPKADDVEIIAKNKQVKIRMKTDDFLKGDDVRVILFYTNLNEIHANEGSQITSDNVISAENLLLNAKEGALINLSVEANSLEIKTNSGGKIAVSGSAESQSVVSNSGGNYDGQQLKTIKTEVTVNAGGEARVYATGKVDAKTRAGGNIHIFGGAEVAQQTLAGGKIHIH